MSCVYWEPKSMTAVILDMGAELSRSAARFQTAKRAGTPTNNYFWRTYARQEIDWVEESAGALAAFEFKWNPKAKARVPAAWKNAYPDATFAVVTPENFTDFIC